VDAPCSGSGAWRRNPEAKWRLTPDRLKDLTAVQAWLIDDGARHTRPGGRLVYATCSLLPCENTDVTESFLARNPKFRCLSAAQIWSTAVKAPLPPGMRDNLTATPLKTGTDGFFVCIMQAD